MRYLVKEFPVDSGSEFLFGYRNHLVDDEGDERTEGSLWYWIRKAKREDVEISVYRLVDLSTYRPDESTREVLGIGEDGKLKFVWGWDQSRAEAAKTEHVDYYRLECVLDLS